MARSIEFVLAQSSEGPLTVDARARLEYIRDVCLGQCEWDGQHFGRGDANTTPVETKPAPAELASPAEVIKIRPSVAFRQAFPSPSQAYDPLGVDR